MVTGDGEASSVPGQRAQADSTRAGIDSTRAMADSGRAQKDSDRAQGDSDNRERKSLYRLLAYVGMGLAGAIGLWYVQGIAEEANDTAERLKAAEAREERQEKAEAAEEKQEAEDACILRNTFQQNTREGDGRIIDAFEAAVVASAQDGPPDPERLARSRAALQKIREFVLEGRSPEAEDRDCNEDGTLDEKDYAP